MEVKINREIREYTESMFFGLSLRQAIFSALACIVAVVTYFVLKPLVGLETTSWVCILVAIPFGVLGFLTYNGMHAEEFIWAWIKSELLMPKKLRFSGKTTYYWILREAYLDDVKSRKVTSRILAKIKPNKKDSDKNSGRNEKKNRKEETRRTKRRKLK